MQIEADIRHAISQSLFMAKHFQKQTANFYPTKVGPYRDGERSLKATKGFISSKKFSASSHDKSARQSPQGLINRLNCG